MYINIYVCEKGCYVYIYIYCLYIYIYINAGVSEIKTIKNKVFSFFLR